MDRFLLAENPMNSGGHSLAIIHTIEPIAIIEVLEGHHKPKPVGWYAWYQYNEENYTLRLHHYFTEDMNADNHEKAAHKLLDKAWRWYRAYMEWEDNNIDLEEHGKNN